MHGATIKIYLEVLINLEIKIVSGEKTHSRWRKTYRRSPSVTACRKTIQREGKRIVPADSGSNSDSESWR